MKDIRDCFVEDEEEEEVSYPCCIDRMQPVNFVHNHAALVEAEDVHDRSSGQTIHFHQLLGEVDNPYRCEGEVGSFFLFPLSAAVFRSLTNMSSLVLVLAATFRLYYCT